MPEDDLERLLSHLWLNAAPEKLDIALTRPWIDEVPDQTRAEHDALESGGVELLNLVLTEVLATDAPNTPSKDIARRVASLTDDRTLAKTAQKIGLDRLLGPRKETKRPHLASAYRTVIGAVYTDRPDADDADLPSPLSRSYVNACTAVLNTHDWAIQEKKQELQARLRLLETLGLEFTPPDLDAALTHISYVHEHGTSEHATAGRLSFLGDPVIKLAVNEDLYTSLPELPEGGLAKRENWILSEETLAETARRIGLGQLLLLGQGEDKTGGRDRDSNLAAALQSTFGAIYLDPRYGPENPRLHNAMAAVRRVHGWAVEEAKRGRFGSEWKNRLRAWVESLELAPKPEAIYDIAEAGPDHRKRFHATVMVEGEPVSEAPGPTKKAAELGAAEKAVRRYEAVFGVSEPSQLTEPHRETLRRRRPGR